MSTAIVALALYTAGLTLALGARSFAHHRRTGDWDPGVRTLRAAQVPGGIV